MADYNYLSKGDSASTILGNATTSKIAFWGITPVDQPDALTVKLSTLTYTTATTPTSIMVVSATATTSSAGFVTTAEMAGCLNVVKQTQIRIKELEARLVEVGIIAGGTAVATATSVPYDFVGYGSDDGTILGKATTSLISFYGVVPCDQPAAVTTASDHPTLILTATATAGVVDVTISLGVVNGYGIGASEGAAEAHSFLGMVANVQIRLAEIETNLAEVGLIAGGTALTSATGYNYLDKGNDDGTIMGVSATQKLAFWGGTPCAQAAALTDAVATISFVSATMTYAITSMLVGTSTFKFVSVTAGNTLLFAVQNAQTRLDEIETALNNCGLQAT